MNPKVLAAVVALLAVGVAVAPTAAVVVPSADGVATDGDPAREYPSRADESTGNAASSDGAARDTQNTTPGQRLSGVVGVQDAEIAGEIGERSYDARVASAGTPGAKAAVVADQLDDAGDGLATLRERKERLDRARENGSIAAGEYRARVARLAAEIRGVERLVNASERTAGSLPADVLAEKGIDADAIRTLKAEARNLTGPEVAEIARSIAGKGAGRGIAGERGPPGAGPGNRTTGPGNGGAGDGAPGRDDGGDEGTTGPGDGAGDGSPGAGNGDRSDGTPGSDAGNGNQSDGTPGSDAGSGSDRGTDAGNGAAGGTADDGGSGDETTTDSGGSDDAASDDTTTTDGERGE